MDTRHTIEEFVFELNFDDLAPAADFEANLHDWLRQELLPPFEALFDSLSGPGETLRIDVLEIDLGDLAYEDLRHELPMRLMEKLRNVLEERLARQRGTDAIAGQGGAGAGAMRPSKARDTGVQELLDFLAHGRLPWQASADRVAAHEHLLARVAEREAEALLRGIDASPQRKTMVERLARQFSASHLMSLAHQAAPEHGALLAQLAELFPSETAQPFWESVFYALLDRHPGDARSLAERILERFRGTRAWESARAAALEKLSHASTPDAQRLLRAIVAAASDVLPGAALSGTTSSSENATDAAMQSPSDLESIRRALREARLSLRELDLDAAEMARLVALFIERDEAAGAGNRTAFLRAIDEHGAQARQKRKFYTLVLQSLMDGRLVDLDAFLRESLGAEAADLPRPAGRQPHAPVAPVADAKRAAPQVGGTDVATNRLGTPPAAHESHESATAARQAEDNGPLRFRLAHCLLNGDVTQLESIWHLLYRRHAGLTREALLHYGKFERVQRRFALDYPDTMLRDFVELIEPLALETVAFLTERTVAFAPAEPSEWKRSVWDAAFAFLLRDGAAAFSRTALAEFLLRRIAAKDTANDATHAVDKQTAFLAWGKKLRGDGPSALQLTAWRLALAERSQALENANPADPADAVLLARLLQSLKRRRKDAGELAPALAAALDLVFTARPQLLPAMLEAYRRGDLPALLPMLEYRQLRRLVLAWIGLMPVRGPAGVVITADDRAAFVDAIATRAGASADPAVYLRAVLEQLRRGRQIDPADSAVITSDIEREGAQDAVPAAALDSSMSAGIEHGAGQPAIEAKDSLVVAEGMSLSEADLLQRIDSESKRVFGRGKARQAFHADFLAHLERTLDRHGVLRTTWQQLREGASPDFNATFQPDDAASAVMREHVLAIVGKAAADSPPATAALSAALSHLREAPLDVLGRIGEAELLAIIERYLESVALADAGNRRLFMETAASQARRAGDRKRFLAQVLSHLVRNDTVDFDDILARSKAMEKTEGLAGAHDAADSAAPSDHAAAMAQATQRRPGDDALAAFNAKSSQNADALAAATAPSLAELRTSLSHAITRKAMDAGRRAAFLHAIEHHAQLAGDRRTFYRLVSDAVEMDEAVDLEAFARHAGESGPLRAAVEQPIDQGRTADAAQDSWEPFDHGDGSDREADLARLRQALIEEITRQSGDEERRAAFLHSIEHHAQLAADRQRFYALVLDAVLKGDAVDLESCVEQSAAVASAAAVDDVAMPSALREAVEEGNAKRTEAALREVFTRKLRSFQQVRGWFADGEAGRRLFGLLSPTVAARVFSLLLGADYALADRLAEMAVDALAFVSGRISRQSAVKLKQRTIFELLLVHRVDFDPERFIEGAAALVAQETGDDDARLVRELIESHAEAHFAPERARAQQAVREAAGKPASSAVASAPDTAAQSPGETSLSNVDVHLENAGLILTWPYLPALFTRLNLMEKNVFVDARAAERAVHLLQFAATGETHTPEYALVLNKQLCGIATGVPIIGGIDITDVERETIESLLEAMIGHWKALGKTSVNGFREAFLQRQGWLTLAEEAWHLRVQTRAYDMLLDQLPWGISMVKLAWMSRPIETKWR